MVPLTKTYVGLQHYDLILQEMQSYAEQRHSTTRDEIWLLEHSPVFTLGLAAKREHLLNPGTISVIQSDRGGQVTYHGPGQLIIYTLIDILRLNIGVKRFVYLLEQTVIDYLQSLGIPSTRMPRAPGVYTERGKIAALGLRVKNGRTYHGLSLNVNMDLRPFAGINPCGQPGQKVCQLCDYNIDLGLHTAGEELAKIFIEHLTHR